MLLDTLTMAYNFEKVLEKYLRGEILSKEEMRSVVESYNKICREISTVEDIALLLLNWYPSLSNASLVNKCRNLYNTKAFRKSEELLILFKKVPKHKTCVDKKNQ